MQNGIKVKKLNNKCFKAQGKMNKKSKLKKAIVKKER